MKANASKHKAMSYARMAAKEAELEREVAELLWQAEEMDAREDSLYGLICRELTGTHEARDVEDGLRKWCWTNSLARTRSFFR